MRTEDLFEEWNIAIDDIVGAACEMMPASPSALFLGGSLAEHLGTLSSDIDLIAIMDSTQPERQGIVSSVCNAEFSGVRLSVSVAEEASLRNVGMKLHQLLLSRDGALPRLNHEDVFALHAIYRDRHLGPERNSTDLRFASGADLYPLLMVLRAASLFVAHIDDVVEMRSSHLRTQALGSLRYAVEAAIDLWLASEDFVAPNPKWRIALLERASLHGKLEAHLDVLLAGLFPAHNATNAEASCLEAIRCCLEPVTRDAFFGGFSAVERASDFLGSLSGVEALNPPVVPR